MGDGTTRAGMNRYRTLSCFQTTPDYSSNTVAHRHPRPILLLATHALEQWSLLSTTEDSTLYPGLAPTQEIAWPQCWLQSSSCSHA